jgi:peptidoglycan/LPS O-acetylase OafA/YrhL
VRATLHDELMYEAGFEVDYFQELERRRERRRRLTVRLAVLVVSSVVVVASAVELLGDYFPVPDAITGVALAVGAVTPLVHLVAGFIGRLRGNED